METIHFSQIDLAIRGRTVYRGIPELAESILHNGLIQPIILSEEGQEHFFLLAGGRRWHALEQLFLSNQWDGILTHASTSKPGAPGYLLKGEAGTELSNLLTELAENLDRQDMDWRDEVPMIVKAARLAKEEALVNGHEIVMRDLGAIIGCGYQDYRAAEAVALDLKDNPKDYENATGVRQAYAILLKKNQQFMESLLVKNTLIRNAVQPEPSEGGDPSAGPKQLSGAESGDGTVQSTPIPLTSKFHHTNGILWLTQNPDSFDHIICDPDFAVAQDVLEAGATGAGSGIAQASVEDSLADLKLFLPAAFHALHEHGFCVFFYDLDHHEKLQTWAKAAGFCVQRWPFIWHKTDYNSNAAPSHNQTKDLEYAMVCRKPGTTLAKYPRKSVFSASSGDTTKTLGHPFAKPASVWTELYTAFCLKGQKVADPFAGSGSSVIAAIDYGLDPHGCELQEEHYNSLILNVQAKYRTRLGSSTLFS